MATSKTYTSISSDNNLFDLNLIVSRTIKHVCGDNAAYLTKVREYFNKRYPTMTGVEHAAMVAGFVTKEMSGSHLLEVMDVLGQSVTIHISGATPVQPDSDTDEDASSPIRLADRLAQDISVLDLGKRGLNVLRHGGNIYTLFDLVTKTSADILKIHGLGDTLMTAIYVAMQKIDIHYGMAHTIDNIRNLELPSHTAAKVKDLKISDLSNCAAQDLLSTGHLNSTDVRHIRAALAVFGLPLVE